MKKKTFIIAMMAMAFASANAININETSTIGTADKMEATAHVAPAAEDAMYTGFMFSVYVDTKVEVNVSGPTKYSIFINGKAYKGKTKLKPGDYDVVIKYQANNSDIKASLVTANPRSLKVIDLENGEIVLRSIAINYELPFSKLESVRVSPSKKLVFMSGLTRDAKGKKQTKTFLMETATGKVVREVNYSPTWMTSADRYFYTKEEGESATLMQVDTKDFR